MLAADLAERADNVKRACELLLELGRRDLAVGALASAEHTLTRARDLAGAFWSADRISVAGGGVAGGGAAGGGVAGGGVALGLGIDEALTEVFAESGQVDRAIEMGQRLLALSGCSCRREPSRSTSRACSPRPAYAAARSSPPT